MSATLKMTRGLVHSLYPFVITDGYCEWADLICVLGLERVGYGCGVFGWNWDCHEITSEICVVHGYRSYPKETLKVGGERLEEFKKEAGELRARMNADWRVADGLKAEFRKRFVGWLEERAKVERKKRVEEALAKLGML